MSCHPRFYNTEDTHLFYKMIFKNFKELYGWLPLNTVYYYVQNIENLNTSHLKSTYLTRL